MRRSTGTERDAGLPALRSPWRALGLALVAVLAAACASTAGLPEFRVYQATFDRALATSDQILDELAVAERQSALRLVAKGKEPVVDVEAVAGALAGGGATGASVTTDPRTPERIIEAGGFDEKFYVRDAVYVAELGDPPGTAAIRRALRSVADFNDVVLAYGEGRALDELKAQAAVLAAESRSALQAASLVVGTGLSTTGLGPALGIVREGADVALQAASREAFRDAVVALQPNVDAILVDIRDTTPTIFSFLTRDLADSAKDLRDADQQAAADAAVARIEAYRRLISNWVIMLEETRAALAATVAAITGPREQSAALADLARSVGDIGARSARINTLLVELRRGGPPG
jgi:hypothetical protein